MTPRVQLFLDGAKHLLGPVAPKIGHASYSFVRRERSLALARSKHPPGIEVAQQVERETGGEHRPSGKEKPRKAKILGDVFWLLKPGGEFYFSDIYADRRVPASLSNDPILYSECLGGALYWNDFLGLAKAAGFTDPLLVEDRPIALTDPAIEKKVGAIRFYSATYRLFKLEGLESHCEDYGQAVIYRGGVPHNEQLFRLDKHHLIEKGRIFPVCGNTYRTLKESRFAPYFEFLGNTDTHFGIFDGCGTFMPFSAEPSSGQRLGEGSCC